MNLETTKQRIYGLDFLRALAILFVMHSHGYVYSSKLINGSNYYWLLVDGVGLFFVLSGFLVGQLLIKSASQKTFGFKQLRDFWIQRWLRTLPGYFCVLTVLIVVYYFKHHQLPPEWQSYFFFFQNFAWPHPLFFKEAWSLAVEEWFYLLMPLVLFLFVKLHRSRANTLLFVIILALLGAIAIRLNFTLNNVYYSDKAFGAEIGKVVITRLDGILFGMLGAWFATFKKDLFYRNKKMFLTLGITILISLNIFHTTFFYIYFYHILTSIGCLCLLPFFSDLKSSKGKVFRVITGISIISYSLYLTNHMIVLRGLMPKLIRVTHLDLQNTWHNLFALVQFWMLSFLCAILLYKLIEKPFLVLRRKIISS